MIMNFFDMLVSKSINGGGGGSGTSNYNDLSNKPSINNVTLTGNKTASALGLQPEITGDVKISSDNVDDTGATNLFVTSGEKSTWSGKQDALTFDDAPTENSNNPVKSGGIYTALSGKQATLTFDDSPTSGSSNPVKSGGVYTALGNKQDTVTFDGTYSASTNKAATVSTVTNAVNALDVTGGSVAASKTLASWSETNGKVSVTTQDIAITGSQAVLTGYSIAQSKQSIAATDTATEAFGKVEQRVQTNENNILTLSDMTQKYNFAETNSGSAAAVVQIPCHVPAGQYYVYIGTLSSTETEGSSRCSFMDTNDSAVSDVNYISRGSDKWQLFTVTANTNTLWIYASNNYNPSYTVTVSNVMIISKEQHDSGLTVYQPYTPSVHDLYNMILALQ